MILHRWPAWLKTSLCTSPLRSHTCSTVTCELTVKGSVHGAVCFADLLCPRVKLVEELLRDVGCIPRHGYHGADACNTCQLLVKCPRQWLRSYSIFHEMRKICFFYVKFDSVTSRRRPLFCAFVCVDILLNQLILCTQTGVQHVTRLFR